MGSLTVGVFGATTHEPMHSRMMVSRRQDNVVPECLEGGRRRWQIREGKVFVDVGGMGQRFLEDGVAIEFIHDGVDSVTCRGKQWVGQSLCQFLPETAEPTACIGDIGGW